jgi:hypothetical protein
MSRSASPLLQLAEKISSVFLWATRHRVGSTHGTTPYHDECERKPREALRRSWRKVEKNFELSTTTTAGLPPVPTRTSAITRTITRSKGQKLQAPPREPRKLLPKSCSTRKDLLKIYSKTAHPMSLLQTEMQSMKLRNHESVTATLSRLLTKIRCMTGRMTSMQSKSLR